MDWYCILGTERHGPMDESALRAMLASGEISSDARVWNESLPEWIPASRALPPELPQAAGGKKARKKPKRRIARALFFWVVIAGVVNDAVSMSLITISFTTIAIAISMALFFGLILLVPFAIIENKFAYSFRMLVYILIPVIFNVGELALSSAGFLGNFIGGDGAFSEYSLGAYMIWREFSALFCAMIAVDGFARLREEARKGFSMPKLLNETKA